MQTTKIGPGLTVKIPNHVATQMKLSEGAELKFQIEQGRVILTTYRQKGAESSALPRRRYAETD